MRRRHLQQREPGTSRGGSSSGGSDGRSDGGRDGRGAWLPPASGDVLLVTGNNYLRDETARIVAAAGGNLRTAADATQAAAGWDNADVVLIGSDVRELPPRRRAPAVLLGVSGEDGNIWQLAAVLGAERVALLPEAAAWLAEHLSASRSPEAGGHVLGLSGGSGGAGVSTAAAWLAQAAAESGARTLLIDGDPWGGGLELSLAAEDVPGLRWPDLAGARGSLDPVQLSDSLPIAGGFSFLSWPGTRERPPAVDPASVAAVMDAARRGFEVVIVDIGRGTDSLRSFAWDCDRILLLATAQLKSAVAAARLLNELPPVDTGLVIRGNTGAGMDAPLIAESLGLPLDGVLPEVRGTGAAGELGRLLELGRRKPVRRFTAGVLELLDGDVP